MSSREPAVSAPARARRAAGFGGASALLAWLAHGVGGGMLPSVWLLLVGGAAVALAAVPLLGREATWPRIVVGLAVAQSGLHLWLQVTGSHGAHHGHAGHGLTASMLAAHAVATLAAAVWLRYFEQAVWSAARRAWVRLLLHRRRWLPLPRVRTAGGSAPTCVAVAVLLPLLGAGACGVRGPPAAAGP